MASRLDKKVSRKKRARYSDGSDNLFIRHNLALSVYHVPTDSEVSFKAMITDMTENYGSEWNKEKVYGRSDAIATFQNTERTISLSWQTAAGSEEEARNNMGSVGLLISMLYPTYEVKDFNLGAPKLFSSAVLSASPLVRLKFSNLIANSEFTDLSYFTAKRDGQLGIIESLSVTPDLDAGFVHIRRGGLMPKVYNLSISFTAIHEHPVGWGAYFDGSTRFFTAQQDGKAAQFPYGATHVERNTDKYDADQENDRFNSPNSYTRTRLRPPIELQGQGLDLTVSDSRRAGPEQSTAAKLKKNGF